MKRVICIVLSFLFVFSLIYYPVSVAYAVDYSYKFDPALSKKLDDMGDDEWISVSIWIKDIDYDEVKRTTLNELKDSLSKSVIDIVNNDNGDKTQMLLHDEKDMSIASRKKASLQMQSYIETKRRIASDSHLSNNLDSIKKLGLDNSNARIIYCSSLSPTIDLLIKKNQLLNVISSSCIEHVYYYNARLEMIDDTEEAESLPMRDTDSTYFQRTGINQLQNVWGLNGSGVKVGVYDAEFNQLTDSFLSFFEKSELRNNVSTHTYVAQSGIINNSSLCHGNVVSCIIAGYKTQNGVLKYKGAVPYADMYWSAEYTYKQCLEYLVNCGCNVINMSKKIGLPTDEYNYWVDVYGEYCIDGIINEINDYGDVSKWLDYMIRNYSINLVCSAGNIGVQGVTSGKMAHNAIVVGNCDSNGDLANDSSYSTDEELPYKPDLVAPGTNLSVIRSDCSLGGVSGTSYAAPIVTGAVAQLCQQSALLRNSPTLMKAVLLSGSIRTSEMISNNCQSVLGSTSPALSRKYGCGLLNAVNMYTSFVDNAYYACNEQGYYFPLNNNVTYTKRLRFRSTDINKRIRAVATWDKYVSAINGGIIPDDLCIMSFSVECPNHNVYSTQYNYDNKALLDIPPSGTGDYIFTLSRVSNNIPTGHYLNYAISFNVCQE